MSEELAITPRNLGAVNLATYCPRCFKYLLHQRFHPPFNSFGAAIFSDMQKSQEAVIGYHLAKNGRLPKELSPFCNCVARTDFPHSWQNYGYQHKSGIRLYGAPDEIFDCDDDTICVIDLKTAHVKEKADPFYPQYQCQVIGYADIAENGLGLGKVSKGGLIYWEAQLGDVQKNPSAHYSQGALSVDFTPATKEIEIDYSVIDKAIKEAKKIWNTRGVPEGRAKCTDCKKLDLLFAIDEDFQIQDKQLLHTFGDFQSIREDVLTRDFNRRHGRGAALAEMKIMGPDMFSADGIVSNWEWAPPMAA
jgi:hypothetical protein